MKKDRNRNPIVNPRHWPIALLLAASLLLNGCSPAPPTGTRTQTPPVATARPARTPTVIPEDRSTQTPTPLPTLDVQEEDLRGIQLLFWHPWQGEPARALQDLADGFNQGNEWGIRVETIGQPGLDALNKQMHQPSDELPHVTVAYLYQASAWDQETVALEPYLNDPQWGYSETEQSDFYQAFWEPVRSGQDGDGLPALQSGNLLVYNQAWAQELGFASPPATQEEFREQACAAAQALRQDSDPANDGRGGWFVSTDYAAVLGWLSAAGADPFTMGEDPYRFDTPGVEAAFRFLRGMYDAGCAWQAEDLAPQATFAGRQSLFISLSLAGLAYQEQVLSQAGGQAAWTVLAYPPADEAGAPAISVYGPSYVIRKTTEAEELASWLWIKWLLAPENHARFASATGSFPLRPAEREALNAYSTGHPQWAAALDLLPQAHSEPALESWGLVRWAVFDAATQLFRYYFTIDGVPSLVKLLDTTAADLHTGPAEELPAIPATATVNGLSATGTVSPTPAVAATPTP